MGFEMGFGIRTNPGYRMLENHFESRIPNIECWKIISNPESRISNVGKSFRIPNPEYRILSAHSNPESRISNVFVDLYSKSRLSNLLIYSHLFLIRMKWCKSSKSSLRFLQKSQPDFPLQKSLLDPFLTPLCETQHFTPFMKIFCVKSHFSRIYS